MCIAALAGFPQAIVFVFVLIEAYIGTPKLPEMGNALLVVAALYNQGDIRMRTSLLGILRVKFPNLHVQCLNVIPVNSLSGSKSIHRWHANVLQSHFEAEPLSRECMNFGKALVTGLEFRGGIYDGIRISVV